MYKEIKGDAVEYFKQFEGNCALVHQVNAKGVMASGIAKQIREEFPEHYEDYVRKTPYLYLGQTIKTIVQVDGLCKLVVGVVGQNNYGKDGRRYTNYAALFNGVTYITGMVDNIIVPKYIGCGLGGGDWDIVEVFLKDLAAGYGCNIIVVEKE